ncbi:MAG: hypothetical protein V4489_06580 [Chlamydiota bacterium]
MEVSLNVSSQEAQIPSQKLSRNSELDNKITARITSQLKSIQVKANLGKLEQNKSFQKTAQNRNSSSSTFDWSSLKEGEILTQEELEVVEALCNQRSKSSARVASLKIENNSSIKKV